jgi:hypothetical protein
VVFFFGGFPDPPEEVGAESSITFESVYSPDVWSLSVRVP